MAADLTIREASRFKELTGVSWTKAASTMQPTFCQGHRLTIKACKACAKAEGMCGPHMEAFQECRECETLGDVDDLWLAAAVYLRRVRDDEERTFDEFCDQVTYPEMTRMLSNLGETEPGTSSTRSTKAGSRRSSTGSRG